MKAGQIRRPGIIVKMHNITAKIKIPKDKTVEEHRVHKKLHRTDGPAKVYESGRKEWWLYGLEHRVDGPAIVYDSGCEEEWFYMGNCHRHGGPAVTYNSGSTEWWSHGSLHREDGPAFNGKTVIEWYLGGERIDSKEEYQELTGLSGEDMVALILKYGDRFKEYR